MPHSKNLDRAIVLACEYERKTYFGGRSAETIQIENTIGSLVGRWVDGTLVLPEIVLSAMGRG